MSEEGDGYRQRGNLPAAPDANPRSIAEGVSFECAGRRATEGAVGGAGALGRGAAPGSGQLPHSLTPRYAGKPSVASFIIFIISPDIPVNRERLTPSRMAFRTLFDPRL